MRILIAVALAAWAAQAAQARSPIVAVEQPPAAEAPAQPSGDKPLQPSGDKPAQPSGEQPSQPGVLIQRVDSTPEVLQAPVEPFFRPFHSPTTGQLETPVKPPKLIGVDRKSGLMRLYTVREFKKKHSQEIKALRKSLRKRPNAEIRKAVEAMEAGQKAELKSLQEAIVTEAEKNQTGAPQPKPENEINTDKAD
ncbi:MAG: hypothetical protein A2X31_00820 [Elusimicrobia bacterium GWB2_63_22]|nr:MAG: hypothetical protein A2X31_00820 [Elusimicrobia bacterium GWB2_63_22]